MEIVNKKVLSIVAICTCFIYSEPAIAQEYDTIKTPTLSEHMKLGILSIDNEIKSQKCAEFAKDEFDLIKMKSTIAINPTNCGDTMTSFRISWVEFDTEVAVSMIEGYDNTYYGYLTVGDSKISKGIIIRSYLSELYYIKLKDGFLSYANIDLISDQELVNNIEAIYFLSRELLPINIATFEKGRMTTLKLNKQHYIFTKECEDLIPNLLNIGFDVIPMITTGLECTHVSSHGEVQNYNDWLAYYEFDSK